jgi:hypothetical protein
MVAPQDLPQRDLYRSANTDVDDAVRATLTVHRLIRDVPEDSPHKIADMLKIQSITTSDEERTQIVVDSVDSGKIYLFGRQTRLYTVSAFIVDSLDRSETRRGDPLAGDVYRGSYHLLSEWLNLYEEYFRLTKCFEKNLIVRLRWRTSEYWGYITSNVRSGESSNQNVVIVSFTFVHLFGEEHVTIDFVDPEADSDRRRSISGDPFPAMLSAEGYRHIMSHLPEAAREVESANSSVSKYIKGRSRVP